MNRKKMDWSKHAVVLTITILVFFTGILLGSYLNTNKLNELNELSEELRVSAMSSELEFAILTDNPCKVTEYGFLNEELDDLSGKVEFMENQLGRNNQEVIKLKNFYSIVQLRHYLLMTKLTEQCDLNTSNIVYFYSNEGDCPECNEQGFILSYLKNLYPINIYSIDINSQNNAVRALKEVYDIETAPSFIIDGEPYYEFQSTNALRTILQR
ncbi:MAG: hypothetical protein ACMXX9_04600 [Candidatus Woesearchaeota archaeon]